jgi:hypothetical protein
MKKENDVLQYVSNSLNQISDYITKKYPEREWMYRAQRLYWEKYIRPMKGDILLSGIV